MHGYKQCMMTCNLPIIPKPGTNVRSALKGASFSFHLSCDKKLYQNYILICAMVKSRYIGDGHPTFNREPL